MKVKRKNSGWCVYLNFTILMKIYYFYKRCCDARCYDEGCKSELYDYYRSHGVLRFSCKECDYDICDKCFYYYK